MKADAKRLAVAREIGATHTFGEHGENVSEAIRGLGDSYGVDVVIDAAGVSATLKLALEIVRPGGQVSKVGWGREPLDFSLDPLVGKGITLRGSFSHNWTMWEKVLGMLASGQINLDRILNRVAPLEEWKSCFDEMHVGNLVKAVLKP